ncbi:MAG: SUMF1/EgtB/PvdO family nonheme iron enzyme, partial [Chthoniobacteraceae bacterium]|nr:SUMF1/EgtB/PvdO family nonheme iron enzyme [Chthoniobacteraceae bacterium]
TVYRGEVEFLGKNDAPALDNIAWYAGNSSVNYTGRGWDVSGVTERQYTGETGGPRRVGTKGANPWGLQDMIGNVAEWCADWYEADITRRTLDPMGPASGVLRVLRGGSWRIVAACCRAAYRGRFNPGSLSGSAGFRPALVPSS